MDNSGNHTFSISRQTNNLKAYPKPLIFRTFCVKESHLRIKPNSELAIQRFWIKVDRYRSVSIFMNARTLLIICILENWGVYNSLLVQNYEESFCKSMPCFYIPEENPQSLKMWQKITKTWSAVLWQFLNCVTIIL